MKKLLLILLLFSAIPSFSQSWAAPGATWYYDFQYFACTGFERIQKTGDTIIEGRQYDKLEIFRKWRCFNPSDSGSYTIPQLEFTRAVNGIVYIYRDSADYVLYDFNAQAGDSWVVRAETIMNSGVCDTGTVVTDSATTVIINGDTLRKIYTQPFDPNFPMMSFYFPVVEKIGGLANLFPYQMCLTDIPQGYGLRCYFDSTGWTYHGPTYSNTSCDDMTGIHESITLANPLNIITDPSGHKITVISPQLNQGALLRIYDFRGQVMLEQSVYTAGSVELYFPSESSGIYFLTIFSENFFGSRSFIYAGN